MIIDYVRHGLSEANIKQLVTGDRFDPLSASGRKQAQALSGWIAEKAELYDGYYCSPWKRAYETALILSSSALWIKDERLGETNGGDVASWTRERFFISYPHFYESPVNEYPGGESHIQLRQRVLEVLNGVLRVHEESSLEGGKPFTELRLLVVAHAGPIACVLHEALGVTMDKFPALMPHNASVTSIKYTSADVKLGRVISVGSSPLFV